MILVPLDELTNRTHAHKRQYRYDRDRVSCPGPEPTPCILSRVLVTRQHDTHITRRREQAMITRDHIALSLMCSLIAGVAIIPASPLFSLLLASGACIGVILPDIQMKRPKKRGFLTIAWLITRFARTVCVPIMCRCYRFIPGINAANCDKRLTHSVPGILFMIAIIAGIQYGVMRLTGFSFRITSADLFLCGIFLGLCLHLVQDLCTRKGITPLYPFSPVRISGSIRPCDRSDGRILKFSLQHCSVLAGFVVLVTAGLIPLEDTLPAALLGLAICAGMMWSLSSVRISCGSELQPVFPTGSPNIPA